LVINGGDLGQACTQADDFGMPQEQFTEISIAYLIPGAAMSPEATAAFPGCPMAAWPAAPVYWYTPPTS
jgi:hypothetical protein